MSDREAFGEGFTAFSKGLSMVDNPYNETTRKFESWVDGWEAAWEDTNALVKPRYEEG